MADKVLARVAVRPGSNFTFKRRKPDETFGWDKEASKAELVELLAKIDVLQLRLAAEGSRSLLVVLQAIDAAGKDGTIRAVFGPLDASDVKVANFRSPSEGELAHDFLWRVHAEAPGDGEIAVWNRSHYEDVLIVRVKKLVPEARWRNRYRHIREFERTLAEEGTRIVKINLHISNEEQRSRLQDRIDDPNKRWKFRVGDLEDRKQWPSYMQAYEEAINETTTDYAPWYVVPAERKWVRNLAVARIVHHVLSDMDPKLPPDDPAMLGVVVE